MAALSTTSRSISCHQFHSKASVVRPRGVVNTVRTFTAPQMLHRHSLQRDKRATLRRRRVATTDTAPVEFYDVSYAEDEEELPGILVEEEPEDDSTHDRWQGWVDADGNLDARLLAKLRILTAVARDRVEMHKVLAIQRSNWNSLFHGTITFAALSSASAAAFNAAFPALGLTLVATALNFACALFMALVNLQQPSQLGEEQLRAARFFRRLIVDVDFTLDIDPRLREDASLYWEEKVNTLHNLDNAFPLPLTPNGLEKFPKEIALPTSETPDDKAALQIDAAVDLISTLESKTVTPKFDKISGWPLEDPGWTHKHEEYLDQTRKLLLTGDIREMVKVAEKAESVNLWLAKLSPLLAVAAAVINILDAIPSIAFAAPWLAAALAVGALFAHSASHAMQLGGTFEVYRNYAGYYSDIGQTIARVLDLPKHLRGDWQLFIHKINMELGHHPLRCSLRSDDRAGRLF